MKGERSEVVEAHAALAERLRHAARRVQTWEDRAVKEALAAGRGAKRWEDAELLERLADALNPPEGEPGPPVRLYLRKNGRGRPRGGVFTFDRDLEIATFIHQHGGTVEAGVLAATARFNISEKTAWNAWSAYGEIASLPPGEARDLVHYFARLNAKHPGLVRMSELPAKN